MAGQSLKSDILLLFTAVIWGFAFVAQRIGMDYVGPFTFNGVRFALGALVLLPIVLQIRCEDTEAARKIAKTSPGTIVWGGILAGVALFLGASLQQVGLVYTTAGKAGFITGLYVVLVPIIGLFFGQKTHAGTWLGAVMAASGLYLLSVKEDFGIDVGDLLVLIGAFMWAGHVLIIGWLSPRMDSSVLALIQYATCSALSLLVGFIFETMKLTAIWQAAGPIFYGGVLSVGVAYTLQVVAQRRAHPAHAAILLSLEAVFAAVGGWLMLNELLSLRSLIGCGLMLAGMLASQLFYLFLPHPAFGPNA
jgi:drug/metabolite transporter (DMT)-like permease